MNELKPEDVMRAFECCSKDDCDNCPNDFGNCYANLAGYALALLREKDAEIERLTAYNANLLCANTDITNRHKDYVEEAERIARRDAITEFAERLKGFMVQNICVVDDGTDAIYKEINKIAKEMKRRK